MSGVVYFNGAPVGFATEVCIETKAGMTSPIFIAHENTALNLLAAIEAKGVTVEIHKVIQFVGKNSHSEMVSTLDRIDVFAIQRPKPVAKQKAEWKRRTVGRR